MKPLTGQSKQLPLSTYRGSLQDLCSFRWPLTTVGNRPDGTVEVHVAGDIETLEAFVAELEVGPQMARVEGVDDFRSDGSLPTHFEII